MALWNWFSLERVTRTGLCNCINFEPQWIRSDGVAASNMALLSGIVVPVQSAVVSANKIFPSTWVLVRNLTVAVVVKNCPKAQNGFLILVLFWAKWIQSTSSKRVSFGFIIFFWELQPPVDQDLLIHEVSRHTQRRTTVGRTPLDEWSARRTDLYLHHTQHSQQTDIHRTPLDEWSARRTDLYLKTHNTQNRQTSIGLLWTSDQPVAQSSTRQHTTLTTDRHP